MVIILTSLTSRWKFKKAEKDLEQEMIRRRELEMIMEIMEKDLKIRQSSLVLMKKENEALKSTNAQLQADLQVYSIVEHVRLSSE